MLKAAADLLTTTFEESLKKLVAPSALIPAIVLVFLHVVLVHPTWTGANLPGTGLLGGLDDAGRIAALVLAILGASYIIGSLAPSFLSLASGDSELVKGVLGERSRRRHNASRKRLGDELAKVQRNLATAAADAKSGLTREKRRISLELHERYADDDVLIAPTSLGNILNAGAWTVWTRHGIDFSALWPHMTPVLAADESLARRLEDQEARVHTFINLAIVAGFVAIEALVIRAAFREWQAALASAALAIVLAAVFYRASLGPARAWMDTIEAVFDLHHAELRDKLKLREPTSPAGERTQWEKTSQMLAYGERLDSVLALGADAKPRITGSSSENITAEIVSSTLDEPPVQPFTGERSWTYTYLVAVTVKDRKLIGRGIVPSGHIKIADAQVPSIRSAPAPAETRGVSAEARPVREGNGDVLLWLVGDLTPGSVGYFSYRLPHLKVTAPTGATVVSADVPEAKRMYTFEIENTSSADRELTLVVWDARLGRREITVTIEGAPDLIVDPHPDTGAYSISTVVAGGRRTILTVDPGEE